MQKNERLLLLALMAVALAVRLVSIYQFGPSILKFGDAPDYLSAATSLCSSASYPDRGSMPFFRAPGLPFFIATVTLCHTEMIWLVKTALAAVDTVSAAIVFLLAEELFRNRRTSFVAATAAAIYPFFIAQVCDIQTEGLFMFLFITAVWLALRAVRRPVPYLLLLPGMCAGAAALVRPVGLILLPLLAAIPIYFASSGAVKNRNRLRLLASFAIGAAICLGPWVVRNGLRYHELILVNDAGGYNFWRGTSAEMAEIGRIADPQAFSDASIRFETITSPAIAREVDRAANTPSSRSREWYKRALHSFAEDPGAFSLRLFRNALAYWRPWLNPQTHSRAVVAVSGFVMLLLDIFALLGWNLLRTRDGRLAWWCAAGALLFWILQIPFQVVSRFRIPITDPLLIIFAAAALTAVGKRRQLVRPSQKV